MKMKIRILWTLVLFGLGSGMTLKASEPVEDTCRCAEYPSKEQWVDSLLGGMNLEEKIGQMIMPAAYSNRDKKHEDYILSLVRDHKIGGVIFFQGTPEKQALLTDLYQSAAEVPLLVATDGEWGLGMRLTGGFSYPWNMTLGAVADDNLIFEVGKRIGLHCKRIGVNVNFAPCVDINSNPQNPIIGNRSFGSDRDNVARKGQAWIDGLQSAGVMGSIKHFPGHGDTDKDSHEVLPVISHTREHLDSIEMYPFRKISQGGVSSIMVAHLSVPALEKDPLAASSVSPNVVENILFKEWGYQGLVFSDALNMKGITRNLPAGEIEVRAVEAGLDVLECVQDPLVAIRSIKKAVESRRIPQERIERSVRKILGAKYDYELFCSEPVDTAGISYDIWNEADSALYLSVMENAVTLLRNHSDHLPIREIAEKPVYWVYMGEGETSTFGEWLRRYAPVKAIDGNKASAEELEKLPGEACYIVSWHSTSKTAWTSPEIRSADRTKIAALAAKPDNTLVLFNNPYGLLGWDDYNGYRSLLIGYQNTWYAHLAMAEVLFGAVGPKGQLPVGIGEEYSAGFGLSFDPLERLRYGFPSQEGVDPEDFVKIDSILNDVVTLKAAPGGQVMISKNSRVIFERNFGTTMYQDKGSVPVNSDMLYDVASVTKAAATTLAVMRLVEEGKISLSDRLSRLLPYTKGTNKEKITVRELLTHNSGLKAWIPFYTCTMEPETGRRIDSLYSPRKSFDCSLQVCDSLYVRSSFVDTIRRQILESDLLRYKRYNYSDLGFILLKDVVESQTGEPLNRVVEDVFYKPLGAFHTTFLPLEKFSPGQIAPSEDDTYWRRTLLDGYVHDMGAALMGGVSGHAGLFSNADDLMKIGQMLLEKGTYGGHKFFEKSTVEQFTRHQQIKGNRRALGFDRPDTDDKVLSGESYGHLGFTGTMFWVEPSCRMVFVMLTNRTYPTMENTLFSSNSYRTEALHAAFKALSEAGE